MTRPATPTLGLLFPAYNEEPVLPALLKILGDLDLGVPHRVLFVDDGSTDRTLAILQEACRKDSRLACVSFSRNFGKEAAVAAGFQMIQGDIVAVLDADLQDPLELLRDFIEKWREGYDVVYGIRQNRKEGLALRAAYKTFYWLLSKVSSIDIPRDAGDFALMDRRVVDAITALPERNRFMRGLRGWVGFRQIGVPYSRPARHAGVTHFNFRRLSRLAIDGLISFSSVPLQISSWAGGIMALVGFAYLLYIVVLYLTGAPMPPGWASIIVLVLLLGGIQLLVLGIIGTYLSRIFEEIKRRPHFVTQSAHGWLTRTEKPSAVNTPDI